MTIEQKTPVTVSPELIIGVTAPVGTPVEMFCTSLESCLKDFDYAATALHLSRYTDGFMLDSPMPGTDVGEANRICQMMDRGNELREKTQHQDVLALCAIADILAKRPDQRVPLVKNAFVLRQLKRPDEVYRLRQVYGDGFHLIGLYCPRTERIENLIHRGASEQEAQDLIQRDEHEPSRWGQDLSDTFHLADVFLDLSEGPATFEKKLGRWVELLFGSAIHSPSMAEFGIFQAYGAALRSAQLSRQVGAALLSPLGDLISVGTNEVPCFGGGQYWVHHGEKDRRDHVLGRDFNDEISRRIVAEMVETLHPDWQALEQNEQERILELTIQRLADSRVMNLTEFGRAVHAEMEAILSAGRTGRSTLDCTLYSTTYPCHNCTKHIVDAGIREVVYIEPYPKSLALDVHEDSVALEKTENGKVVFKPLVGVAPRRYIELFSNTTMEGRRIRRKDSDGKLLALEQDLRLKMPYFSCFERERQAANMLGSLSGLEGRDDGK